MAVKPTAAPVAELKGSWENPLMPNKRLRELYVAMVELRQLEEHLAQLPRRGRSSIKLLHHRGIEGCLVSTALSLIRGDLTSEPSTGIAIDFLRGTKLADVVHPSSSTPDSTHTKLPAVADTSVRLHVAIGAAVALASKKNSLLAVAYIHAGDLTFQQWKPVLKLAATHTAPVLFVVLPRDGKAIKPGQLSLSATACGVPGIPVDAADPVALYRVAQEAMLRIRAGGGPVLMECIPFQIAGTAPKPADPILTMQEFMLPRGVATEAWFEAVGTRFATRLQALGK